MITYLELELFIHITEYKILIKACPQRVLCSKFFNFLCRRVVGVSMLHRPVPTIAREPKIKAQEKENNYLQLYVYTDKG